jgi:hypothetical protein
LASADWRDGRPRPCDIGSRMGPNHGPRRYAHPAPPPAFIPRGSNPGPALADWVLHPRQSGCHRP